MPLLIPIFKNSVPCYSSFSTGRPSGKVGHLSQSSTQSHVKTSIRVQALAVSPIHVGTWGCVTIKSDVISLRVLLAQWINFSLWRQSWNDVIKNDITTIQGISNDAIITRKAFYYYISLQNGSLEGLWKADDLCFELPHKFCPTLQKGLPSSIFLLHC